jgi:hypothetical protein
MEMVLRLLADDGQPELSVTDLLIQGRLIVRASSG